MQNETAQDSLNNEEIIVGKGTSFNRIRRIT